MQFFTLCNSKIVNLLFEITEDGHLTLEHVVGLVLQMCRVFPKNGKAWPMRYPQSSKLQELVHERDPHSPTLG